MSPIIRWSWCALLLFLSAGCAAADRDVDAADALAWFGRGAYHEAAGDYETALQSYERACALDPGAAEPRVARARALLATGDQRGAMDSLEQVLERSPRHLTALSYLAEITFRRGLWSKAIRYNAELLRARPDLLNPAHHLRAIMKRGQAAAAIVIVLREVSGDPRASPYLVETVAELAPNPVSR